MTLNLSNDQTDAVGKIAHWYRHDREYQQTFFLSGYAGTGKTTSLNYAIDELGLGGARIAYATFTMKAALVLQRNGLPCSTIHRLIYTPVEQSELAYDEARRELALLREARPADMPEALWRRRMRDLEGQLGDIRKVKFTLNLKSRIRDAALVVLDEVSMVNEEMADDILAFDRPVLVVGDPGQLPPIRGASPFASATPDAMLTQIHRQAAESPILYLATLARQGERIPFGSFGPTVARLRRGARTPGELLEASIVITGKTATRRQLNNAMRTAAGFAEPLPLGRGEKLIGLKNQHDLGLYNGQFVEVRNVDNPDNLSFQADIVTEDGDVLEKQWVYRGHFDDHIAFDKDREARDYFARRDLSELDWGYALTVHKSQGSGFDNVVVVDDGFGYWDRGLRSKWLYTAITRASDTLVILA